MGIEQRKPNSTPPYTQSGRRLNSLDGSSRVFFELGKIYWNLLANSIDMRNSFEFLSESTQKTDLLFLRAGKKVSKKTVPLVHPQESKILRIVGWNPKEMPESYRSVEVQIWT